MNNLKILFPFFILFVSVSTSSLFGQALAIGLDGRFNDWTSEAASYTDTQGDGNSFDLLSFKVSNDSNFLFIQLVLDREIQLNNGNNLYLEIDTDNDASTGYQVNGIGAELGIAFGTKTFYFNPASGTVQVSPYDIGFIALPTVSSDTFEMAINRHAVPDGINQLFTSNTIKICFKSDDYMPDTGTTFSYTIDETPVETYNLVSFEKNNPSDIRLMTYNTLQDGLISSDNQRVTAFKNIITAVNPDIITFNECWNTSKYQAETLLNSWIPLQGQDWTCIKNDAGNITCSKYPVPAYYDIDPTGINRITANLIDLPNSYPRDFLVINAHLKCCGDDDTRQTEVDAIINFIRDIKTSGGGITLPYGTPFVISGDLNLVGLSQQLTTLLTGDIIDNSTFGEDISPDWDNSGLNDIISFHTDKRFATTWCDEGTYWPGRFDFAIASDIGATLSKAFTICTREMTSERLNQYNLNIDDTYIASDHLPKVTDFIIEDVPGNISDVRNSNINIYPNPAINKQFSVSSKTQINNIDIFSLTGKIIYSKKVDDNKININLLRFPSGIYFIKIKTSNSENIFKVIL